MAKPAARKGDRCTGHPGAPPRINDQGSPDTFINGLAAHRQGDHWIKHKDHDSILAQGSPTVFVNGKAQGRVGDRVACGSFVATGSPDVFVGDAPTIQAPVESTTSSAPRGLGALIARIRGGGGSFSGAGAIEGETDIEDDGSEVDEVQDPDAPVNASDLDWLVVCMMDEALNQRTPDAWAAVARVVLNRRALNFNENPQNPAWRGTIKGVVLATDAFSGFYFEMRGRYTRVVRRGNYAGAERRGLNKMAKYKKNPRWNQMQAVAQQVVDGTYRGSSEYQKIQSRSSVFYANLAITPRPGFLRYGNGKPAAARVAKIEDHTFYRKI